MKRLLLFCMAELTLLTASAQSACNNQDFEDTSYVNWVGATGTTPFSFLTPNTSWTPGIITTGLNASVFNSNNRITLITANYLDSIVRDTAINGPDPLMTSLAPNGGSVSVRLGNTNINSECEKLTYQFTVTSSDPWFHYQFATVMQDPGHTFDNQPYFMVNLYDQSMNIVPNGTDTIYSADPDYPFLSYNDIVNGFGPIQYRHWTQVVIDLSAYIGQTMTIDFINSDCGLSGHFGYTYLDVSCFGAPIVNVWPGDTDYDLQCNTSDLIPLALAMGATGTARAGASNSWTAQPSADWSQSFAFGMNYKHSDCNGDGVVDLNDTLPILLNYSQTHPFRRPATDAVQLSGPNISLVPVNDTAGPANYVDVDIYIGLNQPVDYLSGVSFDILYDNQLVQPNTISEDFSGSLFGTKNTDMLTLTQNDWAQGRTGISLSKMGPVELNGSGYIGRFRLATAAVTAPATLNLTVTNIKAYNHDLAPMTLSPEGGSIFIDPSLPAGISSPSMERFSFYPNPANGMLTVNTSAEVNTITITDALGREVLRVPVTGTQTQLNLDGFAAGIYSLNVISANGTSSQKLVVQ